METTDDYMQICKRITKARKEKGLSQVECTLLLGQKSSYMSKIETGTSTLTVPALIKIAEVLDCSANYLIYGKEQELSEKEQQLIDSYRKLPKKNKDTLLVYADFCCLEAEWEKLSDSEQANIRHTDSEP